jgi:hypothetical protein
MILTYWPPNFQAPALGQGVGLPPITNQYASCAAACGLVDISTQTPALFGYAGAARTNWAIASRGQGMESTNLDPEVENALRQFRTLDPAQKAQFNLAEVNEVELPPELAQPIAAAGDMPELPEAARVPAELGAGACPWLDRYIEYSDYGVPGL